MIEQDYKEIDRTGIKPRDYGPVDRVEYFSQQRPDAGKIKYLMRTIYKNGTIKQKIIGVEKKGQMLWGHKTLEEQ